MDDNGSGVALYVTDGLPVGLVVSRVRVVVSQ